MRGSAVKYLSNLKQFLTRIAYSMTHFRSVVSGESVILYELDSAALIIIANNTKIIAQILYRNFYLKSQ